MARLAAKRVRPFTGRHMTLIMVGFFGVVIAVNVLLANLAVSTFSGTVVENSYVASQEFNGWLGAAKADKALGWHMTLARKGAGNVRFTLMDASGRPLAGAAVRAQADHPLGAKAPVTMTPREVAPGVYEAALPAGRWHVGMEVRSNGHVWHAEDDAL
ncbi:FixH family protein [Novosphingobium sp.]|uniref:FixH family protein n=1 Tax=Novosphingobium sp. TaxID=1874826 RepID=UPI003BAB704F